MPDPLTLRPVEDRDAEIVWRWGNDIEARRHGRRQEPIPWEEHLAYWNNGDPNRLWFVAEAGDEQVGEIRFLLHGPVAVVSVHVYPPVQGRGYGAVLIREATALVLPRLGPQGRVDAHIGVDNLRSQETFRRAGYLPTGTTVDGLLVYSCSAP